MPTIYELKKLIAANRLAESAARGAEREALTKAGFRLGDQLHHAKLANHVGGKVITRYRGLCPKLDEIVGVLLAVRRTRVTVDFDGVRWTMPVNSIIPESERTMRGGVLKSLALA